MKRVYVLIVTMAMLLGLLTGCSTNSMNVKTITDCSGAEVAIHGSIEKVVCTVPAGVAFMVAMGQEEKLIGTHGSVLNHSWAPLFYEGFNGMDLYGKKPNAEEMIKANADIVIINSAEYAEELRKSGINAICFNYTNKEELCNAVNMLGDIFGDEAKTYASTWNKYLEDTVAKISEDIAAVPETARRNIYYADATGAEATSETIYNTQGGGSFVEYWIETIGGNLVTSPYDGIETIEQETALSLNPDTIFICGWLEHQYKELLMNDPLWQDIAAIRNNRVFTMPTSMVAYDRFAVELPLLLDYSCNLLYPEYHQFDGIAELKEFYERYYDRTFSDEQLENMYNGLNPDGTKMGEGK